jgi:SSS family solute:Na+ symporter/sodium/proline symporter
MILASFVIFLAVVLAIGIGSIRRSRGTSVDYYLASCDVHPALAGLSAVATNNSGYMFIGVIGFTYATGLAAIWLMIGWIVGDFLASVVVHRELRLATQRTEQITFAGVVSRWGGREQRFVRMLIALLTVMFLGAYAAAQFSAGGKALQAVFGWEAQTGAIMVAIVVAIYCLAQTPSAACQVATVSTDRSSTAGKMACLKKVQNQAEKNITSDMMNRMKPMRRPIRTTGV